MSRLVVLAVPVLVLALAGCVPTPDPAPTSTPTTSSSGTPSPTPTADASATPTPGPDTEPVTQGCSDLISAQAIYDFNPNVSLLDDFSPSAGSFAGEAVAQQGLACRLINQSSGTTYDIGIVRFTAAAFPAKADSIEGSATPASAFDGYFDIADGTGVAQATVEPYWVTISSNGFLEAGDAAPLVDAVTGTLG